MPYIVVENVGRDGNKEQVCKVGLYDEGTLTRLGTCTVLKLAELGRFVLSRGYKPLNFSVTSNGEVQQDAGSFDRFHPGGVMVVLGRYTSRGGRTVGYRLVSSLSGAVVAMRTGDILARAKGLDRPFLQNGIIRGDMINCYPSHDYKVLFADTKQSRRVQTGEAVTVQDRGTAAMVQRREKAESSGGAKFTAEQLKEIQACREKGIDSKFIEDVRLTPKQMRILWVSKSNGALSEYFASPEYSVQAMKFYADRLFGKKLVKDCMPMLRVPTLTVDKLSELYLCVCDGVDYTDLLGYSADTINVERLKRTVFVDTGFTEDDMYDKAVGVLRRMNKIPSNNVTSSGGEIVERGE